ncbi:hypothetical protein B0H14DRAFT_1686394 [Mycena olivaceomarginata]|nr:hypothetical protein B0H14DRAFT_1686394 [Mycena olivaceomarginata]
MVGPVSVLSACLRASELGCATPLLCVAHIHPFPHHIHRFPHLLPPATISGTTTHSPSTPAPLLHHLHHHSARAAHPHARAVPAAAVLYRRRRTDRHPAHHSVFRRILPSALGTCAWAHPRPDLHQCPALARSAVPPRGRTTRYLCARCDVLGTLPLQSLCPPLSRNTTRSHSIICSCSACEQQLPFACIAFVASPHAATFLGVF